MYRNDHISLLRDSMLPNVLNFAFIYFIVTEKKKITLKEKEIVKRNTVLTKFKTNSVCLHFSRKPLPNKNP